jgi:AcrR family transcriptional regulator
MINSKSADDVTLSRRERERLVHRQEIMEAALSIFSEKGYFNTTLDEIAQKADFSKGTLYLYFQSKEDLLYTIIKEKSEEWYQMLNGIIQRSHGFKDGLQTMFLYAARQSFMDQRYFSIHSIHHTPAFKALSPERWKEFIDCHDRMEERSIEQIQHYIDSGELRNVCPKMIFGILHGSIENLLITRWGCDSMEELIQAIDQYIDIIFNGIAKEREIERET